MANQEHLALLKRGVKHWNRWRQKFQDVQPDLKKANLEGANLSQANLSNVNLAGANLRGADLDGANLSKADLTKANLSGANLRGADLEGANLSKADLTEANFISTYTVGYGEAESYDVSLPFEEITKDNTKFRGANLSSVNLSRAYLCIFDLEEVILSHANLTEADLSYTNLKGADLTGADLRGANLQNADLSRAKLTGADLTNKYGGAPRWTSGNDFMKGHYSAVGNVRSANLAKAKLTGADLSKANLEEVELHEADLSRAKLNDAKLTGADLSGADLSWADLSGARLSEASVGNTKFANVNLSETKGLAEIKHVMSSLTALHTIKLPQDGSAFHFLRGAGVSDEWINFYRTQMMHPIQYHSCFISYSSKDEALARRLHADLQAQGVRCWFAPEDMKVGDKIRSRIDEAIHLQDKLLLLLSEHALTSNWVEDEVEAALEKERRQQREVLFPIRLDESVMQTTQAWAVKVRRRHIGDFTKWTNPQAYEQAFERLLRDLKAEIKRGNNG